MQLGQPRDRALVSIVSCVWLWRDAAWLCVWDLHAEMCHAHITDTLMNVPSGYGMNYLNYEYGCVDERIRDRILRFVDVARAVF